ncbi:hypothetical protein [Bacterioplanoides sp. SCSIO 12839]|uniref:hypothetical protein n=1 Tax=Bacterioplanoides sp. SCSIO 12839 TaxID=2829569 RepID=UPI0021083B93|nr:hypothetical protein [Bacterioplanoides sp. SCSIO 12839]UTW48769.1 hypothetical protein KFF03_02360 [Bacterioplanoides sp. SCSIO 12839]
MSGKKYNKAFKSDSQRLAVSLRSSIAKRHSHLNAALCVSESMRIENTKDRRKVKAIEEWSLALVKEDKTREIMNWDETSTWHNSKFIDLESGQEWVIYISDRAYPGEVKLIENCA